MKKLLKLAAVAALGFTAYGCDFLEQVVEAVPVPVGIQLVCDGENFAVEGITVTVSDAEGTFTLEQATDATGLATFELKQGNYTASATYTTSENGTRLAYTGSNNAVAVGLTALLEPVKIELQKVESQQIIIKELYSAGCTSGTKGYTDDAYVILYNNSDIEADATNVVFGFLAPYNGHASNKYLAAGAEGEAAALIYENDSWVPAANAIWWFTSPVKIAPFSQVVVAIFGAVDHTATYPESVNLADASYYWMSNNNITQYTNKKYAAADVIPSTNYLTCHPFSFGNSWVLSNTAPAFFIGNMPAAEIEALCKDTENYDHTQGTGDANNVVKFPQANVIGALEVWSSANIEKSNHRFPAKLNSGYAALTAKQGYTLYRNVDKAATEALAENEGKLVYEYAGGTTDVEGTTDPSGIDAEASIEKGAHIIYKQTNSSANDFHQRKVASLKK